MGSKPMRTVISFDEGCSGNFLAALLSDSQIQRFDRIDDAKNELDYSLAPLFDMFEYTDFKDVIVTHENEYQKIKDFLNPDRIIRVVPRTGMFTAIYNVFVKKHIEEKRTDIMSHWPSSTGYCYDMTFEHIKDYYAKFSKLITHKNFIEFDFGWIYDTDKLLHFLKSINVLDPNITIIENYQRQQLPLLLDLPTSKLMSHITSTIPDYLFNDSPWFACYCIFVYEKIHNLKEHQRKWSIDRLPLLGKDQLIELSLNYE